VDHLAKSDPVRLKRRKKEVVHRKRDRGEEWQSGRMMLA